MLVCPLSIMSGTVQGAVATLLASRMCSLRGRQVATAPCTALISESSTLNFAASQSHFAQFALDALTQIGFIEFLGDADRVADGFRRRAAVTDQHDLLAAQQRRSAEFRIIEALLDAAESLSGQDSSGLRQHRLSQLGLEQSHNRLDQTFAGFQNDVAGETVANDHVDLAGEDVAPFDVSDEIDRGVF